jgi:hypothetical protein
VRLTVVARSNYDVVKAHGFTITSENHGKHKVVPYKGSPFSPKSQTAVVKVVINPCTQWWGHPLKPTRPSTTSSAFIKPSIKRRMLNGLRPLLMRARRRLPSFKTVWAMRNLFVRGSLALLSYRAWFVKKSPYSCLCVIAEIELLLIRRNASSR